jgi:type II secretory pathway predicted ATPase ExeA
VDRPDEVNRLKQVMVDPRSNSFVLVTGESGTGKSFVLQKAAFELSSEYKKAKADKAGIILVRLSEPATSFEVALAEAVGVRGASWGASISEAVHSFRMSAA